MNYVISIIDPNGLDTLLDILNSLELPLSLVLHGRGTATKSMLDLLGIEDRDKRIAMTVADAAKTERLIKEHRRRLYIDVPGNGLVVSVPVKCVGGAKTLNFLSGGQPQRSVPELNYDFELILAIANEGCTDLVMDAARSAGATGGTVLHGKGTGAGNAEKFYKVSIAEEKDLILIVARASEKAAIMNAVIRQAGPDSEAGAIVFSLPVNSIAGFGMIDD